MVIDDDSPEGGFWLSNLTYFKQALELLTLDANEKIEAIGGDNPAWELRADAMDFGEAVFNLSGDRLERNVRDDIRVLVQTLRQFPEVSYQGNAAKALGQPQWGNIKGMAQALLARI